MIIIQVEEIYPVLEVFVHRHYEPWAIMIQPTEENYQAAIENAIWKIKPLRFRLSTTKDWGGLQSCLLRMNKVFAQNLN